jgi:hypothetical protein
VLLHPQPGGPLSSDGTGCTPQLLGHGGAAPAALAAAAPAVRKSHPTPTPSPNRDLEARAKEYQISDTVSFYESAMFRSSGFHLDTQRLNITFAMV